MKKIFSILFLAACVISAGCQSKSYKIEGHGDGLADGDTLYWTTDMETGTPMDTLIVKDGKFEMSGQADSTYLCMIYSAKRNDINVPFFIEPGTIRLTLSRNPGQSKADGTETNEKWQTLNDSVVKIGMQINRIATYIYQNKLTEAEQKDQMAAIEQLNKHFNTFIADYARKNISNEMGYFILTYYPEEVIDYKTRMELIDKLPQRMRNRSVMRKLMQDLKQANKYDIGRQIDDFKMKDLNGTERSIMTLVKQHKVTVIDFWASWCGPCRAEMPSVVEMYKRLNGRGLGIIGISLDEKQEAWANAVKQLHITWPQLSDLKGWQCSAARMFNVNSIPFTIIVDRNGKILNKNLRGKELADFVESQL